LPGNIWVWLRPR